MPGSVARESRDSRGLEEPESWSQDSLVAPIVRHRPGGSEVVNALRSSLCQEREKRKEKGNKKKKKDQVEKR